MNVRPVARVSADVDKDGRKIGYLRDIAVSVDLVI